MAKVKAYVIIHDTETMIVGVKAVENGYQGNGQFMGGCPEPLGGTAGYSDKLGNPGSTKWQQAVIKTLEEEVSEESGGILTLKINSLPNTTYQKNHSYKVGNKEYIDNYYFYPITRQSTNGTVGKNPRFGKVQNYSLNEMIATYAFSIATLKQSAADTNTLGNAMLSILKQEKFPPPGTYKDKNGQTLDQRQQFLNSESLKAMQAFLNSV